MHPREKIMGTRMRRGRVPALRWHEAPEWLMRPWSDADVNTSIEYFCAVTPEYVKFT